MLKNLWEFKVKNRSNIEETVFNLNFNDFLKNQQYFNKTIDDNF